MWSATKRGAMVFQSGIHGQKLELIRRVAIRNLFVPTRLQAAYPPASNMLDAHTSTLQRRPPASIIVTVAHESMQSCGVITLRPRPGAVPRLAGNPGANVEMRFPRCHSARECEHRGNSGQCAGSISSVASSPFVWRQSR
jgi:hypothetical protein